jgi:dTDP-4-dehydrorhamnose 3,5-epimerase-like enzyme
MRKITVEKLPETKEIDGAKRWEDGKGEFVQISYREDIGHVAFFELKKGQFRGNHYHEKKEEVFYIIGGKIRAVFADIDTSEREERILTKGDKVQVPTRLGHIFYGLEDATVVEYSPQYYNKEDVLKINIEG